MTKGVPPLVVATPFLGRRGAERFLMGRRGLSVAGVTTPVSPCTPEGSARARRPVRRWTSRLL